MRFILKAAFWLGLIAFFVPFGGTPKESTANLSVVTAFLGAQEAIADLSGFCSRAPQACDTGREFAIFAGERIGDGVSMAYGLVQGRMAPGTLPAEPATEVAGLPAMSAAAPTASTDPVTTGALAATPVLAKGPSAYQPPRRAAEPMPGEPQAIDAAPAPIAVHPGVSRSGAAAHRAAVAIPTPAPRV